jgi:hypothetical protein
MLSDEKFKELEELHKKMMDLLEEDEPSQENNRNIIGVQAYKQGWDACKEWICKEYNLNIEEVTQREKSDK